MPNLMHHHDLAAGYLSIHRIDIFSKPLVENYRTLLPYGGVVPIFDGQFTVKIKGPASLCSVGTCRFTKAESELEGIQLGPSCMELSKASTGLSEQSPVISSGWRKCIFLIFTSLMTMIQSTGSLTSYAILPWRWPLPKRTRPFDNRHSRTVCGCERLMYPNTMEPRQPERMRGSLCVGINDPCF